MCACVVLLAIAGAALAQQPGSTVPSGVPLRVALEHRVGIRRVGEPIQGKPVDPIYVFDRVVLPAGSIVEGHIAEIGGVPALRRFTAILNGNFTPPRDARAQFDALLLSDGSRLRLRTFPARGTAHTVRIATRGKNQEAPSPFTAPGRMSQLKSTLLGMLPYHRQAWQPGTVFNGVLQEPLKGAPPGSVEVGTQPEAQEVVARLFAPISSATAQRGAPVEAVVTRPLFSADHRLLIPEGVHVLGDVVAAQPARRVHRNGKLLFVFR